MKDTRMKLSDLRKQITPLPWTSIDHMQGNAFARERAFAIHAANQLPKLMEAAQAFLENKNKRLDLQCRHDLRAALAEAQEVRP